VSSIDDHGKIDVVAGLIKDFDGRILFGRRKPGTHMAGYWELPGGKKLSAESAEQALHRELSEELGITVLNATFLMALSYTYPKRNVCLDIWSVDRYEGHPIGREGQDLAWVLPVELNKLKILPADKPLVDTLLK